MTSEERQTLHADLARLLAPLVGEEAVYDPVWRCARGHVVGPTTGWTPLDVCYCTINIGADDENLRVCAASTASVSSEAKPLTDPAVLLPLLELLGADRLLGLQISRLPNEAEGLYWHARLRWALDEWRADGETMGEAVAARLMIDHLANRWPGLFREEDEAQ